MPRQTFTWLPEVGASLKIKPTVEPTKFGDGYELRVPSGINTMPEVWDVRFTELETDAKAILAFLKARAGVEAFDWQTPNGDTLVFVCREWSANRMKNGTMQITCSFEQVFEA